jgi:hypothetical protein
MYRLERQAESVPVGQLPAPNSSAPSGTSMLRNRPAAGTATRGHHEEGEHVPVTERCR